MRAAYLEAITLDAEPTVNVPLALNEQTVLVPVVDAVPPQV